MKCHVFVFLFLLVQAGVFAQSSTFQPYYDVLPPSPTAAALGRYGEIPVSLATGTPGIDIPLGSLSGRQLQADLSLSYLATGIKVDQLPSWVGLGWSLIGEGVITRAVHGLPDDQPGGWLQTASQLSRFLRDCGTPQQFCEDYRMAVQSGQYDPEPDEYYFNFAGMSGKFVFDSSGAAVTLPFQPIKVFYSAPALYDGPFSRPGVQVANGKCINAFTLVDPQGVRYVFDAKEVTTNLLAADPVPMVSSWRLSRMVSPDGREEIRFTYAEEILQLRARDAVARTLIGASLATGKSSLVCQPPLSNEQRRVTETYTLLLDSIVSERGFVKCFNGPREDLTRTLGHPATAGPEAGLAPQGHRLDSLRIFTGDSLLRQVDFFYSTHQHRMYLDSLREKGSAGNVVPPHRFSYQTRSLLPEPVWTYTRSGAVNAIDYWGYYNGVAQSSSIPHTHLNLAGSVNNNGITTPFNHTHHFPGADRSPDPASMTCGMLTGITYPTGGSTLMEFEPHDYSRIAGVVAGRDTLDRKEFPYSFGDLTGASAQVRVSTAGNAYVASKVFTTYSGQIPTGISAQTPVTLNLRIERFFMPGTESALHYIQVRILNLANPQNPTVEASWNAYDLFRQMLVLGNMPDNSLPCAGTFPPPPNTCLDLDSTLYLSLPPGTYQLDVRAQKQGNTCDCDPFLDVMAARANLEFRTLRFDEVKMTGGGLRIKQITIDDGDLDHTNDIVKTYSYTFQDHPGRSSGVLANFPRFTYNHFLPDCYWVTAFNSSQVALGTTGGSLVSYREVTEALYPHEQGKSVQTFSTAWEEPDEITPTSTAIRVNYYYSSGGPGPGFSVAGSYNYVSEAIFDGRVFPYAPITSQSARRGDLLKQELFDADGRRVHMTENRYAFSTDPQHPLAPLNRSVTGLYMHFFPPPSGMLQGVFLDYRQTSLVKHLAETVQTRYDSSGNAHESRTRFYHERPSHAFLTRQQNMGSFGQVRETRFKYPQDYDPGISFGPGSGLTLGDLVSRNMLAFPVETQTWEGTLGALQMTGAFVNTLKNYGSSDTLIRAYRMYLFSHTSPASPAVLNETLNNQGLYSMLISNPGLYRESEVLTYDSQSGQPVHYARVDGSPTSLIWDAQGMLPLAEVKNALPEEVAFSSFESETAGEGGWSFSGGWGSSGYSGSKSKNLGNSGISKTGIPVGRKYLLSFWGKNLNAVVKLNNVAMGSSSGVNTWKYYQFEVDLSSHSAPARLDLVGSGLLDELRLHPVDAQMRSYSYDPRQRISAFCDENSRKSVFRYDDMDRLKASIDQDGNYREVYEYRLDD